MATVSRQISPNRYDGRVANIRLIVLHDGETPETGSAAEGMANWFSHPSTQASSHTTHDNNSRVRVVDDDDTAWCAPGANADGLHAEMAGRAAQNATDWNDAYSVATMNDCADQCAEWADKYRIPVRGLSDAQVADGVTKGFTTHAQISRVFKRSDHWDPGTGFPFAAFLGKVNVALRKRNASSPALHKPVPPRKPASISVPAFPGYCRRGSYGNAVIQVQKRMRARGWTISVDGAYGPQTESVIRAFQQEKGIGNDGIVGPITWRKMWTAKIT